MAAVSLATGSILAPTPETRVIKAAEYRAIVEAEELVAQARERAAAITRQAEAEAEQCRREGRERGLEEGKAEVAEQLFQAVTASVEQLASMEKALVDVVVRSVRAILGEFDDAELAVRVVGHALRLVRDEKRVLLRVAAGDTPAVEARLDEMLRRYPGMGRVDVVADGNQKPGGCVLETDIGVIDATLDRQLQIIEDTFKRTLEERPAR